MRFMDAFLFEGTAKVIGCILTSGVMTVELDDTIFYPGGGGQPCDTGTISNDFFSCLVNEVFKEGDKIIHKVTIQEGDVKPGDKVVMKLNKDRRVSLVRMHTGEHILFKSLETCLEEVSLVKIDLGEEVSSLFIKARAVNWDLLFAAESLANKIISEDRKIKETLLSKDDAVLLEKLRIKPERINSENVRVVEILGFDLSACAGTHAKSTGFVGSMLITGFRQEKGGWEIRFKTGSEDELFNLSRIARQAASSLNTDPVGIGAAIDSIKKSEENYKENFRQVSGMLLDHNKTEKVGKIDLVYNIVNDVEKKQLVDKSNEFAKEMTIVCFISRSEGKGLVLLNISKDLALNAPEILAGLLEKYGGKGGGRDNFAMGTVDAKFAANLIDNLKQFLSTL